MANPRFFRGLAVIVSTENLLHIRPEGGRDGIIPAQRLRRREGKPTRLADNVQHKAAHVPFKVRENVHRLAKLARLGDEGLLRPEVAEVFDLADAADAHRASQSGHVRGKVVVRV